MHDQKQQFIDNYRARRAQGANNAQIAAEMGIKAESLRTRLRRYGTKAESDRGDGSLVHGTTYGYHSKHGCRCEECRRAAREAQRVYRARTRGRTS